MTLKVFLAASLALAFLPCLTFAQKDDFFTGKEVFTNIMEKAKAEGWQKLQIGEVVGKVGVSLVGTPYVGQTIELFDDREVSAVNLKGLDCVTFYESTLAMARTIKTKHLTEAEFKKQIQRIRYRGGRLNGYVSRLHYTTDYFFDNERKSVLNLIADDLPGAEVFPHKVSYMSQHPDQYRQLKANPELVPQIAKMEQEVNARKLFFIPKGKVADIEGLLKTGDILGLTTIKEGLDMSHTGICYRDADGVLRFLHASSLKKQVVLDERLSDFLKKSQVNDGIMVARPLEP